MTYPLGLLHAPLWRVLSILLPNAPSSGEGTQLYCCRGNAKGVAVLYAALDPVTVIPKYDHSFSRPGTLAPYRIEAAVPI